MGEKAPPFSISNSASMESGSVTHCKNLTYNQKHAENILCKSKDTLKAPDKIAAKRNSVINNFV